MKRINEMELEMHGELNGLDLNEVVYVELEEGITEAVIREFYLEESGIYMMKIETPNGERFTTIYNVIDEDDVFEN